MVMRSRTRSVAVVVAFALAVVLVAALAGRGGDGERLIKLPVASLGGAGAASDQAAALGAPEARSSMLFAPGVEYRLTGTLPDLAATAPGYRLGDAATEEAIRRVAGVLGLDGTVRADESSWVLQDGDRALRVAKVPGLPWYVESACPDAPVSSDAKSAEVACARVAGSGGSAGSSGAVVTDLPATTVTEASPPVPCVPETGCVLPVPVPAPGTGEIVKPEIAPEPVPIEGVTPPDKPVRPEGFPTREEAEKLARETFTRLGAGTDGLVVEDGWMTWEARVEMRLDGLPVLGMDSSVSIGASGVERASGWLAVPERIGDYPLVGVEAGFKRLSTPLPAPAPTPRPAVDDVAGAAEPAIEPSIEPAIEPDIADCGDAAAGCVDVPTDPMPPVETMIQNVTGAHLALLNTGQALVPAYVFEIEGGGMFPVPAVTDEWLDTGATRRG